MAKKKLEGIIWPNMPNDEYYLDAEKVEYDAAETYPAGSVGKALQSKAEVDGSYDSMTVGNAEQLVSNVRVNDKTPYLFRTSGGSVDIGDREYVNGIVGGTVAFNQQIERVWANEPYGTVVKNGNEYTYTVVTAGTSYRYGLLTASAIGIVGHKYLLSLKAKSSNTSITIGGDVCNVGFNFSGALGDNYKEYTRLISCTGKQQAYICTRGGSVANDVIYFKDIILIDLTQMFGSTIADYIYSLEQATAGAGVAWFKKLFNKPYYAYNAGELKSVSGLVSHDMTGFNQLDKSTGTDNKYISSSNGSEVADNALWHSDYIRVIPNTNYYTNANGTGYEYPVIAFDANKNFIGRIGGAKPLEFNTGDAHYIIINTVKSLTPVDGLVLNISWDGSRNGEYEPYELHSYPLDTDLTLRGIPKLDANNNLYYDGDEYAPDGTVTRKYGVVVIDGSSDEVFATSGYRIIVTIPENSSRWTNQAELAHKCASDRFVETTNQVTYNGGVGFHLRSNGSNQLIFSLGSDSGMSTETQWRTWFASNPTTVVYELATPTTETADPYQQTQIVNDFGTEEYVISDSTFAVPVGHDTDYPVNLVAKLEMAPNSPEGNGDYIVRQTNGTNEYVPLVIEDALPTIPSTAGTYKLTVTVADGTDPVLSWEAE